MDAPHTTQAGDLGALVDLPAADLDTIQEIARLVRARLRPAACIVGRSSLLLLFERSMPSDDDIADAVQHSPVTRAAAARRQHVIPVSFAPGWSPDLPRLLEVAGISRSQFLAGISSLPLRARYLGFRAGFAYLEGLPPSWTLPRLSTPRTTVSAGSFAVAADSAGFYPVESPGGWNLLGRTNASLWNPQREPPNLIAAGDDVRIVPDESLGFEVPEAAAGPAAETDPAAEVVSPGQLTFITGMPDLARYAFGLPPGGAFDPDAAHAANLAVGNHEDSSLLECALVGPELRVLRPMRLSYQGAQANPAINGQPVTDPAFFEAAAGDRLTIGRITEGLRGWLAISGGIHDPSPRYPIAPHRLRRGEALFCNAAAQQTAEHRNARPRVLSERTIIRCLAGPHEVSDRILSEILDREWTVTPMVDRVAIRLRSDAPTEGIPAALPSLGMQVGSVQWHPSGELVIMGPDHPVTGGYLQPMTVLSTERKKLAQLQPGGVVRWELLH